MTAPRGAGDSASTDAAPITPNDTNMIVATRGIYVGGTGNLSVTMVSGNNATFASLPAGQIFPIRATRVFANTTATNLVAIY